LPDGRNADLHAGAPLKVRLNNGVLFQVATHRPANKTLGVN